MDHQVLQGKVAVAQRDRADQRGEQDDEEAVASPGVQDAVASDGTTYRGVAFLVATS